MFLDKIDGIKSELGEQINDLKGKLREKEIELANEREERKRIEDQHRQAEIDAKINKRLGGQSYTEQDIKDIKAELETKMNTELRNRSHALAERERDIELKLAKPPWGISEQQEERLADLIIEYGENRIRREGLKKQPPEDIEEEGAAVADIDEWDEFID